MTKALIIGGGIAGPVTGMALQRAGMDAVVYEAYDRTGDGVGAYLTIVTNGLDALRVLDLHGVVRDKGFDTPRIAFYSGTGKKLGDLPLGGTLPDGTVSKTIKRADLYSGLRDEALRRGVHMQYGKRLVGADNTPYGGVRAQFADGSQAEGDLLIGADGLRSRTRAIIDPDAPEARYVGLLNTGGYASGISVPGEPGTAAMFFGKHCFFCYMPHPSGEVWWFANPPHAVEPTRAELASITSEQWRARLIDLFAEDRIPATEIIRATPDIFAGWSTYDMPSVPTWHNERMIVVGDAAHATSPSSGQGASMAIEDAVVLGKCLRDMPSVATAFSTYEELRRERVERVVAQGKRNGDMKAVGPVGRALRDLILPVFLRRQARRGEQDLEWMHGHHIEWDTPVISNGAVPSPT